MRYVWLTFRVAFVCYWAYAGYVGLPPAPPAFEAAGPGFSVIGIVWALACGVLGARYYVLRTYLKPQRTEPWLLPSWFANPLAPSQPFQFFHLAAVSFVMFAILSVLRGPRSAAEAASSALPTELFGGAFGVGILVGIHWSIRAFRGRWRASDA